MSLSDNRFLCLSGGATRLVYDFDGIDDYISTPVIVLVVGDVVSVKFIAPTSYSGFMYLLTSDSIFSGNTWLFRYNGGTSSFEAKKATFTIDGIVTTVPPVDGLEHLIELTITTNTDIQKIGYTAEMPNFPMYDFKVNDGSVYYYPINDGFTVNPLIANLGSGSDAVAMNFNAERWINV